MTTGGLSPPYDKERIVKIKFEILMMLWLTSLVFMSALFGCNTTEMTREQISMQREVLRGYSEFARDNNMDFTVVADVNVDGRFELTQGAKYLPLTASARATMTTRSGWTSATPSSELPDVLNSQSAQSPAATKEQVDPGANAPGAKSTVGEAHPTGS